MADQRDEWVANRAYELWDSAGRPDGQDHEHWSQANWDWEMQQARAPAAQHVWENEDE